MVKNKSGGKRSKGLARKATEASGGTTKLRLKEDAAKEAEGLYYYAKVNKSLGNCRFMVQCDDGVDRIASCLHFGKKNRRDNNIEVGSALLVGVADYNTAAAGKCQPCQILELYTPTESPHIPYFQNKDDDESLSDYLDTLTQPVREEAAEEEACYDLESI